MSMRSAVAAVVGLAVPLTFGMIAEQAMAQSIQGTARYRERMALPAGAVFEAAIEEVPIAFAINSPTTVSMMLRRVAAGQTPPAKPGSPARPLEATYWRAIELATKPTPVQNAKREAHLVFQTAGRVSGSDGCNRIAGSYTLKGDGMTFGQTSGTLMACVDSAEIERGFRAALRDASRWKIDGDRLELFDAAGSRLAVFEGRSQTPPPPPAPKLEGTSWQLVKFQGSDDTTLTPDDKSKYTLQFGAGGSVTARIDCNRGRGTWKSSGAGQLELGPPALTRAMCPEGSLHDRIVKHWPYIRSYLIKDGHLFLVLMADGGTYQFEPLRAKP